MMGRKMLVALIVLGVLTVGVVHPPRVQAGIDFEQGLIIAGATAGAVALIAFIAILASSDDDVPDFLADGPRRRIVDPGVRFGFQATRWCPPVGGNISLACW